jgi:hypothetical protein
MRKKVFLETPLGPLVPNYCYEEARTKYAPSVSFYPSGAIKSIRLVKPTLVPTPVGEMPAERLTFFEDGSLNRLFPVDGRISGFWSLNDEKTLNSKIRLDLMFGSFLLYLSGVAFYPTGKLRSVTIWPGQHLELPLPLSGTKVPIGSGFSLFDNGHLSSLEPKRPIIVQTPIGPMEAFDPTATGLTSDRNSLEFNLEGTVNALKSLVIIEVAGPKNLILMSPKTKIHPLDENKKIHYPLSFKFYPNSVSVCRDHSDQRIMNFDLNTIKLRPYLAHNLVNISLKMSPL